MWRDQNPKPPDDPALDQNPVKSNVVKNDPEVDQVTKTTESVTSKFASNENDSPKPRFKDDARVRGLVNALEDFVANSYAPSENCSCHLKSPCVDCVNFKDLREMISAGKKALAQAAKDMGCE